MPTRSGRSGATHSGWARMSSLTSSCARSRSTRCEVCRRPRHSHRPQHRRHACPRCVTDPVVASDGHSYERSAILPVINGGNGLSPLTREQLQPNVLVPNRNLKKRILEFEGNVLDAVDEVSRRRDETEASLRQQLAAAKEQAITLTLALSTLSSISGTRP